MKIPEMVSDVRVMDCPCCGNETKATVHANVTATMGEVIGNAIGVDVKANMARFHITHHCRGRLAESTPHAPDRDASETRGES